MSILKTLKVSQFRYFLALVILLFACSAVLLAQQEDKNAKEKKEESPKKTSQEKQKDQGEPRRGGPAQDKPSQPTPAQSNPRTSNQPQTGTDQNKGQRATDQPQPREKQNPDLQNQENRRTERTNQGQQQGRPAAPPQKQDQPNANRNEMGRGSNQPSGQANTTSRPVPQHGKPGTPAQAPDSPLSQRTTAYSPDGGWRNGAQKRHRTGRRSAHSGRRGNPPRPYRHSPRGSGASGQQAGCFNRSQLRLRAKAGCDCQSLLCAENVCFPWSDLYPGLSPRNIWRNNAANIHSNALLPAGILYLGL